VQVTAVTSGGVAPTPEAGTIVEGMYKLVGVNLYGAATGTTFWRTVRFVGNELKTVERDGAALQDETTAGTYVVNGTQLVRTDTCPGAATHTFGFTAKPTSFTFYETQPGGGVAELIFLFDGV
jgi:hypothetical protein